MNPTLTENSPPPSLEKSEESQNPSPSKQPLGKMASEAVAPRKLRWANSVGLRFGRLEVIEVVGKNKNHHFILKCKCDCGKIMTTTATTLLRKTRSCGCLASELTSSRNRLIKRTHGHSIGGKPSKMYDAHQAMISRCYGNSPQSKGYRERGTTVCDRWRFGENGKTGFECFLEDMPEPEYKYLSVDRKDNEGNYEPSNCRWATPYIQNNNTSANRRLEHGGVTLNIGQWDEKLGLSKGAIYHRLKSGWSITDAVTKKSREKRQTQLANHQTCVKFENASHGPLLAV